MRSSNTAYIERLDHLRFFAAALVVLFHAWLLIGGATRAIRQIPIINQGQVGVQLFMVISGFILAIISYDKELKVPRFYLNRVLRVYPLFLVVLAMGYFATPDPRPTSTTIDFLIAALPISNLSRMSYGEFGGQLWSIAVEMQFYLLFPLLHMMLARRGPRYHLSLLVFLVGIRAALFFLHGTVYDVSYFSLFGCLDVFLIGHLSGWAYRRGYLDLGGQQWALGTVLAICILIWTAERMRLFDHESVLWIIWPDILAVAFAVLVPAYIQCSARIPFSAGLAALGRWSYSIYLWHIAIILIMQRLHLGDLNPYLFGCMVLPVTVAIAAASYHIIERPFLEWRLAYTSPKRNDTVLRGRIDLSARESRVLLPDNGILRPNDLKCGGGGLASAEKAKQRLSP
jgi:peptidoglycan/LPS O-acetylase OafA/YrhL